MKYTFFKHKHAVFAFLTILCLIVLSGCGSKKPKTPVQTGNSSGDYVARIDFKDFGSISVNIYASASKQAADDFVRLANAGYYNGHSVKTVIDDYAVLISAGDDDEAGAGAEAAETSAGDTQIGPDTETANFADGINSDFYPFRGALCITDSGKGISADQFMIVTSDTEFLTELETLLAYRKITPAEYYKTAYGTELDEETLSLFEKYGGAPWLYGHCIVFGQVSEGFDVLEAISGVEVEDGNTYSPLEDIIIESVSIETVNK